jgi:type IV pilus assembly protein PilN
MPRINLLPWREADRQRRQREFLAATAAAFIAGVVVAGFIVFYYDGLIRTQQTRNARLTTEIQDLDKSIEEIEGLERQKERLLARMEIIERLQKSRPEIVHLFDEVARRLPEGVYLTAMVQRGNDVEVTGVAQSSTRVSALMRQIEASEWLNDPGVTRVQTTDSGTSRQAQFVVTMKQISQAEGEEEEAG